MVVSVAIVRARRSQSAIDLVPSPVIRSAVFAVNAIGAPVVTVTDHGRGMTMAASPAHAVETAVSKQVEAINARMANSGERRLSGGYDRQPSSVDQAKGDAVSRG